jgi:hypothetical protein
MPSPIPTPTRDRSHPRVGLPSDLPLPSDQALRAIQALHDASDPFDLLVALFQATRAFGVRASACVHVVPDPERATQLMLLLACDPESAWAYRPAGAWLEHPWLRHARDHTEAVPASMLDALPPAPPLAGTEDPPAFEPPPDLSSVLIVPTHSGGGTGRFSALVLDTTCLSGSAPLAPEACRLLAHSLSSELHEWWLRRTRSDLQHRARLRSDDLKMLAFERQGLSTKQIARLLGIGVTAVDSRFQRINAKLDVSSRRNAALRAAIHGLL